MSQDLKDLRDPRVTKANLDRRATKAHLANKASKDPLVLRATRANQVRVVLLDLRANLESKTNSFSLTQCGDNRKYI